MTRTKYNREYHIKNRDRILSYHRKHYAENKEVYAEKRRENYLKNRDIRCAQSREYSKKNKDKVRMRKISPQGMYITYKSNAKQKNREFSLTLEEFTNIVSKPCTYCGIEVSRGIDRVDSKKGYVLSNSVPCCWRCNIMKRELSKSDFFKHIQKIYTRMLDK